VDPQEVSLENVQWRTIYSEYGKTLRLQLFHCGAMARQGEDMSTALAKALVNGLDVEGAEGIWRKINEKNAEMTGKEVTEDLPGEPDDEKESEEAKESTPKPKTIKKDPNKDVYVDFMTFVGNKRKKRKVKKMALIQAEFDEMIFEKGEQIQVQFSLF